MLNPSLDITPDELPPAHVLALKSKAGDGASPANAIVGLTESLMRGAEDAWREFHGRYHGRLQRYLLVITRGDEDAAQEALQQTFLRAVRHMKRFDSEVALWNWLAVLARSAAVDEQRRQMRFRGMLERLFTWREATPPGHSEADASLTRLLESAVAELADDERALLNRKYLDGDSVRDLAASLNTTGKAVDSRLVRIRRKLKQAMLARLKHDASA